MSPKLTFPELGDWTEDLPTPCLIIDEEVLEQAKRRFPQEISTICERALRNELQFMVEDKIPAPHYLEGQLLEYQKNLSDIESSRKELLTRIQETKLLLAESKRLLQEDLIRIMDGTTEKLKINGEEVGQAPINSTDTFVRWQAFIKTQNLRVMETTYYFLVQLEAAGYIKLSEEGITILKQPVD